MPKAVPSVKQDEATAPVTEPERLDVRVSLESIPTALADAVETCAKPAKPASRLRIFLKDYLPALTPIATVVISVVVSIYTYNAEHNRSSEALDRILSEFGGGKEDDRARAIAAIKLAAYGDRAIPAVKMVLGSDDARLRRGGVLVAEQMYRAATVNRGKLTREMLSYYAENDRFLQLSVMEWLVEMGHQLSDKESRLAYEMIKTNLGDRAEKCATMDEAVALQAANFLFIHSFSDSKVLVFGMARQCRNAGVRESAISTIPRIAKSLSREKRDVLLKEDLPSLRNDVPELSDLIDKAAASIQNQGTVR